MEENPPVAEAESLGATPEVQPPSDLPAHENLTPKERKVVFPVKRLVAEHGIIFRGKYTLAQVSLGLGQHDPEEMVTLKDASDAIDNALKNTGTEG